MQVPSSEPKQVFLSGISYQQSSKLSFVTRQPTVFFVLLSISIPPSVIPSLTLQLRDRFLSNQVLWKLLHKSFPLAQQETAARDELVDLISDCVTSLAASWTSVYPSDGDGEFAEEKPSGAVSPSEFALKNSSMYSAQPLSVSVTYTVPKETVNPITEMSLPWSLSRLLDSMHRHTLSFLMICIYLGLNIIAWSSDVLKFDALHSLVRHMIHSAKVEVLFLSDC